MLERPPILAPHAAVATSHPLASGAALEILFRGGSATDAAVGAGAVLSVVEPWASHLGGDAFALVWDAEVGKARAVQGSGVAPRACDPSLYLSAGEIPLRGAHPVTVPGTVGAWFHLLSARGRLPVGEVFAPAITLAEEGFPADGRWEQVGRLHRSVIDADRGLTDLFGSEDDPVRQGDRIRQPDLAATLRGLAQAGAAHLYDGPLGRRIVEEVRSRGGSLSLEDLRGHRTDEVDPIGVDLEGCRLLEQPPVSQGIMVLAILRFLDEADRAGWRIDGTDPRAIAREIHLQIEGYLRTRAYRDRFLCDPSFATPKQIRRWDHWIDREHARGAVERVRSDRVTPIAESPPAPDVRDTTYLCAADRWGNVVSWIQSIFHPFGAGFVVPGAGILLNNRMCGFSLDPSSPNRLEPGKRTVHTLNSWIALREGRPWLVGGTPGAEKQVQTSVQILRGRLASGRSLAEAVHAPRWLIDEKNRVAIEGRIPREVRRRLERYGHEVVRLGPWQGSGTVQALERLDGGGWLACTDPRGTGLAAGY